MKLSQIEYFLMVAEELNFTSAAKRLFISQPALSRQITLMEDELGAKLFFRNSRRVMLTAAGQQLQSDLQDILIQLEQVKQRAAEIGRSTGSSLKIGCFDGAVVNDFLPGVLEKLKCTFPNVQIVLSRCPFMENREAMQRGDIDLLLTLDADWYSPGAYCVSRVVPRRGALIYSKNSALAKKETLSIRDFQNEPVLAIRRAFAPELYQRQCEALRSIGIGSPRIIELENHTTLMTYLELGKGYTVMADIAADKNPALRKFSVGEAGNVWVVAVWRREHPLSELLANCFPVEE